MQVGGQQSRAVKTASRLWSHFWLSFWLMGNCWRRARLPISSGSRAQTCCAKSPKGTRSGVDSQRGMDQQAVTRRVSQWSQAFGDAQMRPVGFRRILHGQDQRHRVATTIGGRNMALHNIVGRNVLVREKARGGFEPCAAATGFGESSPGTLGERMGQLDQTLGPPQVAESRVGQLRDSPTRGIEEVTHGGFLA